MLKREVSPFEFGRRLRIAREAAGVTQARAATAIDVARTTLVAMEKGQRNVRLVEMQSLARVYGTSVNALLRQESVYVDLLPRFRRLPECKDESSTDAARLLTNLVRAEVELENLLGITHSHNFPPQRPLTSGDVSLQADGDAIELRHRLGLGLSPVRDLMSLLELDLGVRVYVRQLHPSVSGLFAYDEQVGACVLLNANHPRERRTQTAAHELGHFLSSRQSPDVLRSDGYENSRMEQYANAFSRAFLTPAWTVTRKFQDITQGASHLTRRHVILLAYTFGVSREAMVRRLEEIGLTKQGTWDWFEDQGGIKNEQARQVLGDLIPEDSDRMEAKRPTTLRLGLLAAAAWRQDLLSEGQIARLLQVDRVELREFLDDVAADEGVDADGAPKLPQ